MLFIIIFADQIESLSLSAVEIGHYAACFKNLKISLAVYPLDARQWFVSHAPDSATSECDAFSFNLETILPEILAQ